MSDWLASVWTVKVQKFIFFCLRTKERGAKRNRAAVPRPIGLKGNGGRLSQPSARFMDDRKR